MHTQFRLYIILIFTALCFSVRAEDINAKKLAPVGLLTDKVLSDSTLKTKDVLVDKILSDSVAKEEKADNTVIDTKRKGGFGQSSCSNINRLIGFNRSL